jgi:hypothetical protein
MTLSAVFFLPLVLLGYHLFAPSSPPFPMDFEAGFGEVLVRRGNRPLPPDTRYRLRKQDHTVGIFPAPAPGESFYFPLEDEGEHKLELVTGDQILASRVVRSLPKAPELRLTPDQTGVEVRLEPSSNQELEVVLLQAQRAARKVLLPAGGGGIRIAWKTPPPKYQIELRDPRTGKLLRRQEGPQP